MKQPRRKFSAAFKAEVALEAIKGIKTISEVAQHYELHPVQVSQRKTDFLAHSSEVFEGEKKHREEIEQLKAERDELFKQIGELRFQNEWIKKNFIYEYA
jgi:transposase